MGDFKLEKGDIGFKFGHKLQNNDVIVAIESKEAADKGKMESATITVTYKVDTTSVFSSSKDNIDGTTGLYELNFNEVGYTGNGVISSEELAISELYVTFIDDQAFLNVKVPLLEAKKRENIKLVDFKVTEEL